MRVYIPAITLLLTGCNTMPVSKCQAVLDKWANDEKKAVEHLNAEWTETYCRDVLQLTIENAQLSHSRMLEVPKACEAFFDEATKGMPVKKGEEHKRESK